MSLRNQDYTDRELLFIVDEVSGETESGFASSLEIATRVFGTKAEENGQRRYVGSRMAWMVKYGFCDRNPEASGEYRLTQAGRELMGGRLTKTVTNALEKMSDGDRTLLLRGVAKDVFARTGPAQEFFRREYQNHFENRARVAVGRRGKRT